MPIELDLLKTMYNGRQVESLEQLRVLWQGEKIHVAVANTALEVEGVDTPEDLEKARLYANSL